MKQAQNLKLPDYNQKIDALARPIGDTLMSRLERALQLAVEDPRPITTTSAAVIVANVEPVDLLPVFLRLKTAVSNILAVGRGFTVVFSDGPQTPTGPTLVVTLTWP